ncbi:TPA: bifunctional UDP-N-acetylglucosamine diphosphorylase/glucosamine-1-phosphate N-acetyltransferase GlmU [Candidatus Gastranaerophilales bacterium HUM_9]|nr:MAG TPA: bifunctional UDP-N-acetylglucosamine diphosphorylase/glucosamine-1-phosphate N-acetyltransferase GlmU [Candidatus Gastranaerophilales bacterium HUM_9]HBX35204.1 bifunctional UDP-N-acetylglucosamine diphosphorylase/glucosamine-1-phosphate N-acetyltransferase GlmU [Cyanobacteria bacterium UBA11440]
MVKSIILAAGKGTRMKSDTPKVLHQIFNKTLLGYVIDAVNNTKLADENYVIVGHQAEKVEEYVNEHYDNAKTVLQSPQLGTGHAVSMVCPYLEDFEGEVIILCGDTPLITSDTLKTFIAGHRELNSDITVMSAVFDNPTNYGRIVRNADGSLNSIVEEKDATVEQKAIKEINAGIYCLNWAKVKNSFSQLKTNNAQGEYYLTDIIKWGNENGLSVNAHILERNEEIYGINSKINLAEATKIMNNRTLNRLMSEGVTIVDPSSTWIDEETEIGKDTIIYPSTYIEGKNKIGSHCKIGPFAHLRGDVVLEDYVKVGNFVEVKKATIKSHTNACHLTYIGDSEIGSNVNIGAGTITANYNPLNKVKSKTVIKDNVKIGSNSVLVAPVEVEEGANVGALSIITKDVPEWSLAITRAPMKVFKDWVKSKLGK